MPTTKTVSEHIRAHLLTSLGYVERINLTHTKPSLDELRESQWCPEFEELMRNRLIMGAIRYAPFADQVGKPSKYDRVTTAIRKLEVYREEGNDELLVDVANYMLIEFMLGDHPNKHFSAVDDDDHCDEKGA